MPIENGKINMSGCQQLATINGGGNPRWTSFVTDGTIVFPTFFEDPLSPLASNRYRGVVLKYTDGEEYTFPAYHAEVLTMFKVGGVANHLGLSEAMILRRCRKAVMRCNNPQTGIYALGGLEEHSAAKRQRRHNDADAWNSGTARPVQIARLQKEVAHDQKRLSGSCAVRGCSSWH